MADFIRFMVMATKEKSGRPPRYGRGAQGKVREVMHEFKEGELKGGKGRHPKVKSREQAIAIGLSEARRAGGKVPLKKGPSESSRQTRR